MNDTTPLLVPIAGEIGERGVSTVAQLADIFPAVLAWVAAQPRASRSVRLGWRGVGKKVERWNLNSRRLMLLSIS
jgi:hypothetical protein